jgi:hypothetical protein
LEHERQGQELLKLTVAGKITVVSKRTYCGARYAREAGEERALKHAAQASEKGKNLTFLSN